MLLAPVLIAGALADATQAQNAAEVVFWNRIESTNPDELKAYLEAYPNGAFAPTARARLQQLAPISLAPRVSSAPSIALSDAAVIREVQERSYNLNYEIGMLNGQMSEETRNAIRDWQRNVNREPTGELTDAELGQLRSARLPTTWGALAYAARGASAVVWSRPSRQEAVSAALADCHAHAGRDSCKVVTAAESGCGALGFYTGTVNCTTHWGAYASVRPTLGQAMHLALTECRTQAKKPEACGIGLTFCADGSHKQWARSLGNAGWRFLTRSLPHALRGRRC